MTDEDLITEDELQPEEAVEEQVEEEVVEEVSQQETGEDWRVKAMSDPKVRERFDAALFGSQDPVYEPPPDPVEEARKELTRIDNEMPQLDEKNMTAEQVTKFMNWQTQRSRAQQAVYDASLEKTRAEVQVQRARSTLEDYIQTTRSADPDFKNYEGEFRKFVRENQIHPNLLENKQVVEMIRKAIGYDSIKGRRKAKAPGAPAVDESYTSQGQRARKSKADAAPQLREPTELDLQLSAYYGIPVEKLIESEGDMNPDSDRWTIPNGVRFSDREKLQRARRAN